MLALPILLIEHPSNGETTTAGNVAAQFGAAVGFVMVPILIAIRCGAPSPRQALARLGVRRFRLSALKWVAAAIGAYLVFASVYVALVGEPEQKDIAGEFGPLPIQFLLVVIAASVSEEICFRGMLFGGLRERLPMVAAAFLSAAVFGALHAITGLSAVPPLIFFGFVLALLYEKTGSIGPCILLHMLNNSLALFLR